ncbi:MAG: hypothetical protein V4596_05520 [Bdellovibrionota bacterium]
MRIKLLLLTSLIFSSSNLYARSYDPTNDLFFAFGSRCKGKGSVNDSAFNDGAGLKYIAESIRDDASCKGITGALNDIQNLNVPRLLRDRNSEDDLEYMSIQANDLELAIQAEMSSATPDMDYIGALKAELVLAKVNIAKSQKLSNQEQTRRRLETIDNFQKYSNTLFARLKQSDECLTKNPNIAAQIGAQILGLGSTMASGYVGSLMLATGSMVDNYVSFVRQHKIGNKIKDVTNNRLGEAVGCSLEGLSYTYCQARDVETIINFNKSKNKDVKSKPSWLDGIGIIGQDVQSYMDWITQVDSGAPAGTIGRADDKKKAFALQNDLRSAGIDIEGILNTAKNTVAQSSNKIEATKKALNDIATKFQVCDTFGNCGLSSGGPFGNAFASDPGCGPFIYLYSKGVDRVRKDNGLIPCKTYVTTQYPIIPDINTEVGPLVDGLVAEATQSINIQLSQVSESNPNLVISKVDARTQNRRSAREFLNSSLAYLENLLGDSNSIAQRKNQRELIEKTRGQIVNALKIIDRTEEGNTDPSKKVADLSKELIPLGDTFAIPKSLSEIINQDIDQKISQGQIDENLAALMQLSSNDSLGELIKYYIGLEAAKTQSRSAKELTRTNLSALSSIFSDSLKNRMEKLSRQAKDDPDAKESLALLCMQTLAVPESPKMGKLDVKQYCDGQVYKSIYDESKISMNYNDLSRKSYPERACAVYDFYRKSYLYGLKSNRGNSPTDKAEGAK